MAVVAETQSLANAVEKALIGNHLTCWEKDGRIHFGTYPSAAVCFDFATERLSQDSQKSDKREKEQIDLTHRAGRRTGLYTIETERKVIRLGSQNDLYTEALNQIEALVPGTMELLSKVKRRTKKPVAETINELYENPSLRRYNDRLECGLYVGLNLSAKEKIANIEEALALASLSDDQFKYTGI
ncbi:MAG: hypothetical protein AAFQ36_13135 [Pseudomonadota bacterium]